MAEAGVPVETGSREQDASGRVFTEIVHQAGGFEGAFIWGPQGPLPEQVVADARHATAAALVDVECSLQSGAQLAVRIGQALRAAGGVAVRMEGSGAASDWDTWLHRLETGDPQSLVLASVLIVDDGGGNFFTCGMHQFELPDVEILKSEPDAACSWLMTFCNYSVAESPLFLTGHTFRPDVETPRRKLERWPDWRHHPADGRHNPWGLWRALAPSEPGLVPEELTPIPTPALVVILMAKEKELGRALTRTELMGVVRSTPAISMEPGDARRVERSRGYVDIEPRLAWEQWQLVRENLQDA